MKQMNAVEAKKKIYRFCAYQERHHQEVRDKLYEYGLYKDDVEDILTHLITEGFLNEERYAKAYAGGKFRMKQWGRNKIVHELEGKGLSNYCIQSGLKEIDPQQYAETLEVLLLKKLRQTEAPNSFALRDKLARYAIQKGFEPDMVWGLVKKMVPQ